MSGKRTEVLDANAAGVARAAEILCDGGLVAIPTETVYGLAARADLADAVARIYQAKARPDFNPLIVHVGSMAQAEKYAVLDDRAHELARRFWPGSLTMVLPARADSPIARAVTAGLPTIALRMPAHELALTLLATTELPLAAPSANPSGAVSPTSAEHVLSGLSERIDAVLDGGPCRAGLESTIVALRPNGEWQLLRPGPIDRELLADLLGPESTGPDGGIEAPGQLERHYAPGKPLRLDVSRAEADEFLIGFGSVAGDCSLSEGGDVDEAAARLYDCLHQAARSAQSRIAVAPIPSQGIGAAINDRLKRAAA